jgi:hypothetical protein
VVGFSLQPNPVSHLQSLGHLARQLAMLTLTVQTVVASRRTATALRMGE